MDALGDLRVRQAALADQQEVVDDVRPALDKVRGVDVLAACRIELVGVAAG
jgi:hypothetical protein